MKINYVQSVRIENVWSHIRQILVISSHLKLWIMVARHNKWMVTMVRTLADQGMYDNVRHVTNEKKRHCAVSIWCSETELFYLVVRRYHGTPRWYPSNTKHRANVISTLACCLWHLRNFKSTKSSIGNIIILLVNVLIFIPSNYMLPYLIIFNASL